MIGVILTLALLAALAASALRVRKRRRISAVAASMPGASAASAIRLDDLGDLDTALRNRRCICGGFLQSLGERSEPFEGRVLRVVRAECGRCEKIQFVYFETATLIH
jgi:hypothetical protein